MKVLAIDDERVKLEYLKNVFKMIPEATLDILVVDEDSTIEEIKVVVADPEVKVIILDNLMPVSGRTIFNLPELRGKKVIIFSSSSQGELEYRYPGASYFFSFSFVQGAEKMKQLIFGEK